MLVWLGEQPVLARSHGSSCRPQPHGGGHPANSINATVPALRCFSWAPHETVYVFQFPSTRRGQQRRGQRRSGLRGRGRDQTCSGSVLPCAPSSHGGSCPAVGRPVTGRPWCHRCGGSAGWTGGRVIAPPRVGCVLAGALLPGELTPFASGSFLGCPVCTVASLFRYVTYPSRRPVRLAGLGVPHRYYRLCSERALHRSDNDTASIGGRRCYRLDVGRCFDHVWVSVWVSVQVRSTSVLLFPIRRGPALRGFINAPERVCLSLKIGRSAVRPRPWPPH
jgi:hypothetical protein